MLGRIGAEKNDGCWGECVMKRIGVEENGC